MVKYLINRNSSAWSTYGDLLNSRLFKKVLEKYSQEITITCSNDKNQLFVNAPESIKSEVEKALDGDGFDFSIFK